MSFLDECRRVGPFSKFRGPNLMIDEEDISTFDALSAQSVEYIEGQVRTARGFGEVWNPAKKITTIYNWLPATSNRLVYFHSGTNVVSRDLSTGVETAVLGSLSANAMSIAESGARVYMGFYDTDGVGSNQGYVWNGAYADKLFQRPLFITTEMTQTAVDFGSGVVTHGDHYLGVILTTRQGYQTRPGPVTSTTAMVFSPLLHHADGTHGVKLSVTSANWPAWAVQAQAVMSTADNPSRYYLVPGAITAIAPGAGTYDILINLADSSLAGKGSVDVTSTPGYFDLMCMSSTDTGPFNPFGILNYGNRMVYLAQLTDSITGAVTSGALVSDQYAPQRITLAKHLLQLPEFRRMTTAFVLGGILYILGPNGTYAFSDNNDYPVKWPAARLVDGRIGSPFPRGVTVNSSRGWAWVCDSTGLYCFQGGVYSYMPTSHRHEPDWNRINFAAPAECLKILDNMVDHMLYIMVPLDGATTPTHLMIWDYHEGVEYNQIKYCGLRPIAGGTYSPGDIELVQSYAQKRKEIWMAPYVAGKVLRQKYSPVDAVATLYSDDGSSIDSFYEMSVAGVHTGPNQQIGDHLRIRGAGTAGITISSLDGLMVHTARDIPLSFTPGKEEFVGYDIQSEGLRIKIDNKNTANNYFILSSLTHYVKSSMGMR